MTNAKVIICDWSKDRDCEEQKASTWDKPLGCHSEDIAGNQRFAILWNTYIEETWNSYI